MSYLRQSLYDLAKYLGYTSLQREPRVRVQIVLGTRASTSYRNWPAGKAAVKLSTRYKSILEDISDVRILQDERRCLGQQIPQLEMLTLLLHDYYSQPYGNHSYKSTDIKGILPSVSLSFLSHIKSTSDTCLPIRRCISSSAKSQR